MMRELNQSSLKHTQKMLALWHLHEKNTYARNWRLKRGRAFSRNGAYFGELTVLCFVMQGLTLTCLLTSCVLCAQTDMLVKI